MIDYSELQLLQKFCFNRVSGEVFKTALDCSLNIETSVGYASEKFEQFKKNQIGFLVNYDERLYKILYETMVSMDYKG